MSLIGDAIKRQRRLTGMTSKALAEQAGLSQQFVGDVQRGYRIPSLETMLLFANVWPDVDSAQWSWLVIRDLYGDPIFHNLWNYAAEVGSETRHREPADTDQPAAGR